MGIKCFPWCNKNLCNYLTKRVKKVPRGAITTFMSGVSELVKKVYVRHQ